MGLCDVDKIRDISPVDNPRNALVATVNNCIKVKIFARCAQPFDLIGISAPNGRAGSSLAQKYRPSNEVYA